MANKPGMKKERVRTHEVRNLTFRGAVSASAFLFDFDVMALAEARRRVLSIWQIGVRVYSVQGALVAVLPQPVEVYSKSCVGLPLVSSRTGYGAPLTAMPLNEKLLDRIKAPPRSIVRWKHGQLLVESLVDEEDLSTWLIADQFNELDLIAPAVPVREVDPILKEEKFDVREKLASGSPKAEGLDEFIESLNKADQAKQTNSPSATAASSASNQEPKSVSAADIEGWLNAVLGKLFKTSETGTRDTAHPKNAAEPSWLDNVLGSLFRDEKQRGETKESSQSPPPPNWSENLKSDFYQMLRDTGLLNFIQERHQEYLHKMVDLFETGNWSEALKYGIPLGSQSGEGAPEPFLDIPYPNSDIRINPNPATSSSALMYSHPEFYERMRKLYRSSVEHLTNEGRFDEAAYVLAELLGEIEEAVAYLERHGRLVLAAELAEARKLRPGLVVRQWYLAGDFDKAVSIARLNGCFQEAVRLLEKDNKDLADSLRETWALHLAEIGNYSAAALVAIDVPELYDQALEWTKLALQLRDKKSGHVLAFWLTYFRSRNEWPEIKERVVKLLDDESRELAPARYSFFTALPQPYTNEIEILARQAGRSLLRDHGRQFISLPKESFLKKLDDRTLRLDVFSCDMTVNSDALVEAAVPIELSFAPDDIGTDTIYDSALLPDGRTILALGEAGVCILDAESKGSEYFSFPATQFVLSSNGDRLLALASRGKTKRITRLDLSSSSYDYLGEAPLTAFATNYDGSIWYAANECELYAVDATQSQFRVLWQMPDVLEDIFSIVCNETSCSFVTCRPDSFDPISGVQFDLLSEDQRGIRTKRIWKCDLPGLVVRSRKYIDAWIYRRNLDRQQAVTTPGGSEINVGPSTNYVNDDELMVRCNDREIILPHHWTRIDKVSIVASDGWIALTFTQTFPEEVSVSLQSFSVPISSWCYLLDLGTLRVRAKLFFDGTTRLAPRLQYGVLTLCDDRGRVIALDLANGAMLRNICI